MVASVKLETARLVLRQWKEDDYTHFAEMSADPEVMAYYPAPLGRIESDALVNKIRSLIAERGWGLWAVEEKQSNQFTGFVGLHTPSADLPCTPCVEIGWRLARKFWGKGYATEAAEAALRYAFKVLVLDEVLSFASVGNKRSIAVMERVKMTDTRRNFEHPNLPPGSALREHVLYRITREEWLSDRQR